MDASEKVLSDFVVACCNAFEVFDGVEKTLDEIALSIKRKVAVSCDLVLGGMTHLMARRLRL